MLHFLHTLPYPNKDPRTVLPPDPLIVGSTAQVIDRRTDPLGARETNGAPPPPPAPPPKPVAPA
jgi:hypothetical protein